MNIMQIFMTLFYFISMYFVFRYFFSKYNFSLKYLFISFLGQFFIAMLDKHFFYKILSIFSNNFSILSIKNEIANNNVILFWINNYLNTKTIILKNSIKIIFLKGLMVLTQAISIVYLLISIIVIFYTAKILFKSEKENFDQTVDEKEFKTMSLLNVFDPNCLYFYLINQRKKLNEIADYLILISFPASIFIFFIEIFNLNLTAFYIFCCTMGISSAIMIFIVRKIFSYFVFLRISIVFSLLANISKLIEAIDFLII